MTAAPPKIPRRVRSDVRLLVWRLGVLGGSATFKNVERVPIVVRGPISWVRHVVLRRDTLKNGRALLQPSDVYRNASFTRARAQGLVRLYPNRDARIPGTDEVACLTLDSRVRVALTRLGRAAFSLWTLQNGGFVEDSASG